MGALKYMGVYRHFKGRYYLRLWDIRDADDCTIRRVQYLSLYKNDFGFLQPWSRDKGKFHKSLQDSYESRYKKLKWYEVIATFAKFIFITICKSIIWFLMFIKLINITCQKNGETKSYNVWEDDYLFSTKKEYGFSKYEYTKEKPLFTDDMSKEHIMGNIYRLLDTIDLHEYFNETLTFEDSADWLYKNYTSYQLYKYLSLDALMDYMNSKEDYEDIRVVRKDNNDIRN